MNALCLIHLLTLLPHLWLWEGACDWSLRRLSRHPQLCKINRTTLQDCYSSVSRVIIETQQWMDYLSLVTPMRLSPFTSRIWSPGNRFPARQVSDEVSATRRTGSLKSWHSVSHQAPSGMSRQADPSQIQQGSGLLLSSNFSQLYPKHAQLIKWLVGRWQNLSDHYYKIERNPYQTWAAWSQYTWRKVWWLYNIEDLAYV